MTPQERAEFNKMKKELEAFKMCKDIVFVENLRRLGIGSVDVDPGASTTGTSQIAGDAANVGSVTTAAQYSGVLTLTDEEGNTYRIGYYS